MHVKVLTVRQSYPVAGFLKRFARAVPQMSSGAACGGPSCGGAPAFARTLGCVLQCLS